MKRRTLIAAIAGGAVAGPAGIIGASQAGAQEGGASAFVDVPTYAQRRNLSCEYASMVIAMGAFGTWVSEWAFDDLVPLSENPHWGFRGDINGEWGGTDDYGVYPEPLVAPLARFGFWGGVFYGQGDASQLRAHLDGGVPVVVWLGLWGDQSFTLYANDGSPYRLTPGYHVVVAYGYDGWGLYVADPATGGTKAWAWGDFLWMWAALDGMAMAVGPA